MTTEHVTHVRADSVQIGDRLIERDGALLTVTSVTSEPRGMVKILMSNGGPIREITARLRGSRQVRRFVEVAS